MKKKTPQKQKKSIVNDKPFTTAEAVQFFGSIKEHFDDNFKVIRERMDATDEKTARQFGEVNSRLQEHSQILGRLMIDVEEIKGGMREKVSVAQFNKLETRLVLLESIVLTGGGKNSKTKAKSGK
jgi:hypothetical protein